MTVSIMGTSMTTSVDGAGHFSFRNVPHGDDVLVFQGPGVNAQLPVTGVADQEDIHMTVVVNGSTATLDAGERDMPGNDVEIEGTIAQVTAAPPSLMIGTTTVSVPAGTLIKNESVLTTFSALSVGERVEVHAANIGGTITATSINVDSENPPVPGATPTPNPGDENGEDNNEVSGTLSAKAGTCPTITFMVSSTKKSITTSTNVSTTATTKFEDSSCTALLSGDSVQVKGTLQTNGSIVASEVQKKGKGN
jgi:hypothetical protein